MSGGRFEYKQYDINYIADQIEHRVLINGKKKTDDELKEEGWRDTDWYKKYPEDLYHYEYPKEVIEKLKEAVIVLRKAAIYAQRVDWLLSGDDGEETFLERLKKDLEEL
jgi:ribonucleotide monophosphatase NagD (HAD superfamily)